MKHPELIGQDIQLIQTPAFTDTRGSFLKLFDGNLAVLKTFVIKQVNFTENENVHTCRGLHYQSGEGAEAKIFRVITGGALLVLVDTRADSSTRGRAFSVPLTSNRQAVIVPRGYATGYCTLVAATRMLYFSDNEYQPVLERGIRWDDSCLQSINVPAFESLVISDKDKSWPDFQ